MTQAEAIRRRGLTRATVVTRALEIGNAEGLDAVSIRRLAADLGVTPMALYRHVHEKQDLINAMTEQVLAGFDLRRGFKLSMDWTDKLRRAISNFKEQMQERPLALPLAIAYSGESGPPSFWRMSEDLLDILLAAGFKRRQALILIRAVSNLLSGYLLLLRQDNPNPVEQLGTQGVELMRKRFELAILAQPREEYPHLVEGAGDMANVWLSDPDRWWNDTVDLIVFGMEAMLARQRGERRPKS